MKDQKLVDPAEPAVVAVPEELSNYLEAQDNLDNNECQGINGESYFALLRRRNYARSALDAALAAAIQQAKEAA